MLKSMKHSKLWPRDRKRKQQIQHSPDINISFTQIWLDFFHQYFALNNAEQQRKEPLGPENHWTALLLTSTWPRFSLFHLISSLIRRTTKKEALRSKTNLSELLPNVFVHDILMLSVFCTTVLHHTTYPSCTELPHTKSHWTMPPWRIPVPFQSHGVQTEHSLCWQELKWHKENQEKQFSRVLVHRGIS